MHIQAAQPKLLTIRNEVLNCSEEETIQNNELEENKNVINSQKNVGEKLESFKIELIVEQPPNEQGKYVFIMFFKTLVALG